MKFLMKIEEIQYIQKKFNYPNLLCVEKRLFPSKNAEKTLEETGVIHKVGRGKYELRTEERYLFGAWSQMRYSAFRSDQTTEKNLYCILANEKEIIVCDRNGNDVELNLFDFNSNTMDNIFCILGEIDTKTIARTSFNITLAVKDFLDLTSGTKQSHIEEWSCRLGINADLLKTYIDCVNQEKDYSILLCEDHVECVGALTKIVNNEVGVCALKHITPKDQTKERIVMMMGNARAVAESLYLF